MFITKHIDIINNTEVALTFANSLKVQAFPCGRRRSSFINTDPEKATVGYYIPFDPESRLNTEANNRKQSSLNGFTQTYLNDWSWSKNSGQLSIVLAGYLFNVALESDCQSPANFGTKLAGLLEDESANHIYANIIAERVRLFQGDPKDYYSEILTSQSATSEPVLDLLITNKDATNVDSYYFSGLSFSNKPLATLSRSDYDAQLGTEFKTHDEIVIYKQEDAETTVQQKIVSLCILDFDSTGSVWTIHNPAKLPQIKHGNSDNSVVIQELYADELNIHNDDNTAIANVDVLQAKSATVGHLDVTDASGGDGGVIAKYVSAETINVPDLSLDGDVSASTISAKKFIQNGKSVPNIALVEDANGYHQLQITLEF